MLDSVINPVHLMIILAIVVVLFGPKRLPEMGQKVGQALREFRSVTSEIRSQIGADEIADSVNGIKSTFSLTGDSPRSAAEIVSDAAPETVSDPAAGTAPDPAAGTVSDAAPETVSDTTDGPLEVVPAVTDAAAEAMAVAGPDGEPAGDAGAAVVPHLDKAAGSDAASLAADDGGVEAFGSLKRGSTSSVRAAGH